MALYTEPYDVADYLDSDEMIEAYLSEIAATGDASLIAKALGDVIRARGGMEQLSATLGISREELERDLLTTAKPDLQILLKVASAFGLKLVFARTSEPLAA